MRTKLSRRSWGFRALTLTAGTGLASFARPVSRVQAIEKDWLYFHYEREPAGLPAVLPELRALPERLSSYYGLKLKVTPVHVLLFKDRQAYLNHLEKTLPRAPRRTSLFVVRGGKPTILATAGKTLARDLLHEAVHAINFGSFGGRQVPLWLDEGGAELFEATQTSQDLVHGEMLRGIMGEQRDALAVPLKLSSLERIELSTKTDALFYAASWAWCRFLAERGTPCHAIWRRYLSDIQADIAAGKLSHRLTLAEPNYETLFLKHLSLKTLDK